MNKRCKLECQDSIHEYENHYDQRKVSRLEILGMILGMSENNAHCVSDTTMHTVAIN